MLKAVLDALESQGITFEKTLVWSGDSSSVELGADMSAYAITMLDTYLPSGGAMAAFCFTTAIIAPGTSGSNSYPVIGSDGSQLGTCEIRNNGMTVTFGMTGRMAKNAYGLKLKQ